MCYGPYLVEDSKFFRILVLLLVSHPPVLKIAVREGRFLFYFLMSS